MILKRTGNDINRIERQGINDNWTKIENNFNNVVKKIEDEVFEKVVDSAKLIWQAPVDTFADLSTTYPNAQVGWAAWARETIGGVAKAYRFNGNEWILHQEFAADAINEVDNRLTEQIVKIDDKLMDIILVSDFAKGDGTNETVELQSAITAAAGKKLIWNIQSGSKYVTNRLNIPSNIIIDFEPGVIIEASNNFTTFENIFRMNMVDNVIMNGNYAILNIVRDNYTDSTEQRHAITLYGSHNIEINNFNIVNAKGDGILIGGSMDLTRSSENVNIDGCIIDNSFRFGITVVGNAKDISINNVKISNSNGAPLNGGIDIEPNTEGELNQNVNVTNSTFINNSRGVLVFDNSKNVLIKGNKFTNSGGISVQRINATRANPTVIISDNVCVRDGQPDTGAAIFVDSVNDVKITNNKGSNFAYGVYVTNSIANTPRVSGTVIEGNNTFNCRQGIVLENTTLNSILKNRVSNSVNNPMSISNSDNFDVQNNEFYSYGAAFLINRSESGVITKNKMRMLGTNINVAFILESTALKINVYENDFTGAATNAAYFSESPSANIGYNIDINGFKNPYINEFNPAISQNLVGQLFIRNQNNRQQLQTAIVRGNDLVYARVPTVFFGTNMPTTGNWTIGDVITNTNPVELGETGSKYFIKEWTCLVSGNPGVFVFSKILTGN